MRAVCMFFAIAGGCALAAVTALELAAGNPAEVGWLLVGPGPFYVAGLIGAFRGPGRGVAAWLLATGATFMVGVCLGDAVADFPAVAASGAAWIILLSRVHVEPVRGGGDRADRALPDRCPAGPRRARGAAHRGPGRRAAAGRFAGRQPGTAGGIFPARRPDIASPLFTSALQSVQPVAAALQFTFAAWVILGPAMLYVRYRRSSPRDRRRIRWLLVGAGSALIVFAALSVVATFATFGSASFAAITVYVLWGLGIVLVLGSLAVALSDDGVLGIDRTARRTVIYRTLWVLIAVVYVAAASALGILASRYLPVGAAMLLAAGAALAFQPVQRRLERFADRWVFGERLDGYEVITRFGGMLETSPGPADLLPRLADAIRQGLALQWVRVRLDPGAAGDRPPMTARPGSLLGRRPNRPTWCR